ncbi:phosphate system positive regulatory protein pho81 [Diatrype stigma]|uniref:Phosphate system positive regulatory protein pho81 n=1 Tax=Diatrype stigma TaxID=117547 RepID=A0AAN9YTD9_9PEZI
MACCWRLRHIMKFGKQIQKRQLEVPEYAASFVNYKALKKLIKKLSATPVLNAQNDPFHHPAPLDTQAALQANKAKFFFQLERELEKVNVFYLQKEAELKIRLKTLIDKKRVLRSRQGISRRSAKFTTLEEGFQQFANDLNKLQQFIEINGTAFSKILKKWDKTSKSKTKELYLSRAVEVQPFFNATVISELSDQATTSLQELGAWADGDNVPFEGRAEHIVSSQHLLGTAESDADTLLLDTAITGNLESLRDLLSRMQIASSSTPSMDIPLMERVTRTFLAAIHEAPQASLEVLLATGLVDIQSEDDINERNYSDHIPLNLACEHGSVEIVELLLKHGARILPDAEGLYPQHLVARSGQTPQLLRLLKQYGADLDQLDKLYGWTPLVHAASEGNVPCLQELLSVGADPNIVDEKDLPAMYYAAWEGHLTCMQLLTPHQSGKTDQETMLPLAPMGSITTPVPMSLDADAIPVLELPPPIIPLRRYGHNFLDTKTVVLMSFEGQGEQPLVFFQDSKYPAARLTISSKTSDLIPKNIMLPFQEDTRLVSFQVDNLDSFTLDFDVFPTYGAKVIAKTVALPNTFRASLSSSGRCCLPLFDPRLRAIGQISFNTHVIKPFQGAPLEITDFETYWKATSQFDQKPNMFVTGSSLSGDFVQLYIQHTSDNIPVIWPTWMASCGGIEIPISRLTYDQFTTIMACSPSREHLDSIASQPLEKIAEVHRVLNSAGISLEHALALLPASMHVNLQVVYPSEEDQRLLRLGPTLDVNNVVDAVLSVVFDHARRQRSERAQAPESVRSVVFSSYNPMLCSTLNWKQPNFPVFLCNDLGQEDATPVSKAVQISGRRTLSVKEADMVPALVDAIKSHGLALVVDRSAEPARDTFPRIPKGVDGLLKNNGVLRFNETIDV